MADSVDNTRYLSETEKVLGVSNIEQVFIKSEKIWDDVETNYNILKHEIYETNDPTLPKNNKKIGENYKRNEQVPLKAEDGLEFVCTKEEITEEFIKKEPDFTQIETQKSTDSEKFLDSNPYFSTGSSAAIRNIKNGLEDICVKKEINEELILKDESDFIQIKTQKKGYSEQVHNNLYFSTEIESIAGPNKNNSEEVKEGRIEQDMSQNRQLNTDESFICSNDVAHKQILHCHPSYTCDVCKKIFNRKSDLHQHYLIHTCEKFFTCNACRTTFHQKDDFEKHKCSQKSFTCDVCQKQFSRLSNLQRHYLIHNCEKSYACDVCGRKFSQKEYVNKHKRNHSEDKPHECDICKKKFTVIGALIQHKRIHTGEKPFACDVCKKTFSQVPHLNKHKIIHTGEKPFECDVCKKTFNDKGYLVVHKRIHSGQKPYPCDECGKQFISSSHLSKHKYIHSFKKKKTQLM